jgi:hypothetical protein
MGALATTSEISWTSNIDANMEHGWELIFMKLCKSEVIQATDESCESLQPPACIYSTLMFILLYIKLCVFRYSKLFRSLLDPTDSGCQACFWLCSLCANGGALYLAYILPSCAAFPSVIILAKIESCASCWISRTLDLQEGLLTGLWRHSW